MGARGRAALEDQRGHGLAAQRDEWRNEKPQNDECGTFREIPLSYSDSIAQERDATLGW